VLVLAIVIKVEDARGITPGDWLIGGATLLLALVTAGLAVFAYRQLTALRDESRRQRTYELYSRYYSKSFFASRNAVRKAMDDAEATGVSLMEASNRLGHDEQNAFDRYVNFMEEASQQYLAGLLDREVAEEGLAYLAWVHWPQWEEYVSEQRRIQKTVRVCENWEDLHRSLADLYELSEQHVIAVARSWLAVLSAREWRLPDQDGRQRGPCYCSAGALRRLVSKRSLFRVGPHWDEMPWSGALQTIRTQHRVLHGVFVAPPVGAEAVGRSHEYVVCSNASAVSGQRAIVLLLRAERDGSRRRSMVRYVVSGFAWFDSVKEARESIGL
jgi:hypothetical protein